MLNPTSHSNVATASHMPCKIFPNEFQGRRTEKGLVHLGTPFEAFWSHHTELDMNVAHLFSDWSDCLSFYLIVTVGEGGGREGCQGFGWWKGGSQWLNDSPHLSTLHKIHKCSKICFASEPQPPGGNFCVQWTLIRQRRRTVPWLHLR